MAFQSVPGTAEAVVRIQLNGVISTNTFYFEQGGGYTQSDIDNLASLVDAWVDNEYLPLISADAAYLSTNVRGLENIVDLAAVDSTGAGVGGVAQKPLPANVTIAIKRETGLTGRSARGRVYIIGMPITWLPTNENLVDPTLLTGMVAALNALRVDVAASSSWEEVVVSRYSNGVKRTTGVVFPVTTYINTDNTVDSQRGRLP